MKLSSITILAAVSLSLAACNSLDNPITNLFHGSGHDGRIYNPQTGQWEWPAEKRAPQEKKSGAVASARGTPAPQNFNDTRYWDAPHNQWVEAPSQRSSTPPKPKPTPPPAESAGAPPAPVAPAPAPAPVRGARATGVYNSSTGKIEWKNPGEYVPSAAPAPTPVPKKRWYWPF